MSKPLRIFVDAHVFDGMFQGTRSYLEGLYKAVIAQFPEIHIVLAAHDTERLARIFGANAPNVEFVGYKSSGRIARLGIEIPKLVAKTKADFAHFQYVGPLVKNCRWIVTIHDLLFLTNPELFPRFYRLSREYPFRRTARLADVLLTDSSVSADAITAFCGVRPAQITTLPLGVNEPFLRDVDAEGARSRVRDKYGVGGYALCVSRLEPRKRQHLLVRHLRALGAETGRPLTCVLVGAPAISYPELQAEILVASTSGLSEQRVDVHLLSQVPDADLPDLYAAAKVFVFPSIAEGFGIPPLEAAAVGAPVLCSNLSAMKDYDFFGADHVDPADDRAFAARLRVLFETPDGARDEALRARQEIVRSRYCWNTIAARFVQRLR